MAINRFVNISIAIAVSAFLAVNFYLLFGEKSIIAKSVYVNKFERMTSGDYSEKLEKEGFIAPMDTYTVYVGEEDMVDTWLVTEGDVVEVGDELAILNMERSESQKNIWQSEYDILTQQELDVAQMILDVQLERGQAKNNNNTKSNKNSREKETVGDTTVEVGLNVDVDVEVSVDGAFVQAIATVEQELADINRQLVVLEAQLEQNPLRPAIISPIEGVVSNVTRLGPTLAIELFSSQKVLLTYAVDSEWKQIQKGLRFLIEENGAEEPVEGTIESVSSMPAKDGTLLDTYKVLDPSRLNNPIAYYEVRIAAESGLELIPFGSNLNGSVIIDEAKDALSIKKEWVRSQDATAEFAMIIDKTGRAVEVKIISPFDWKKRGVVTEGLHLGDVTINGQSLHAYDYSPRTFLPMPSYMPKKNEWRSFGWRNYVKYMTIK